MAAEERIDVAELRVGMFIHLDVGWMRHPFPLSSFRITSEDQLVVIRGLGLKQVRWSPELSSVNEEAAPATSKSEEPATPLDPEQQVAQARREALRQQREALALCEAQYGEASKAATDMLAMALRNAKAAGEQAQALSSSLVKKMLGMGDMNLRLLTEAAGDRACAHSLNVTLISLLLGSACGLGEDELIDLGTGALLHDVGKAELEARFRARTDAFNAQELAAYQLHVAKGVGMAQGMGLSAASLAVIAQHHEHTDGSGFPSKLTGERMHPLSRVVALVNRFDGLCNPPLAGRLHTPHEALSLMFAQGRSRYDATLLNAFIRMMGVYPPGSAVQLTDDRYALVVAVNPVRPLKPRVLVHEPKVPANDALILNLEEEPSLGIRRSLRPADLPAASAQYLKPRSRIAYFIQPAPRGVELPC
jgi:putative nucleotidyltransferase with HDIG domain